MANKGKYKINDRDCFRLTYDGITPIKEHVWSKTANPLVSLCLICYQPKMVER